MKQVIKTALHTVHIVNNAIACVRCNKTGRFISKKQYMMETRIINFQHISNDIAKESNDAFNPCLNVSAKDLAESVIKSNGVSKLDNNWLYEAFTLATIMTMFFIVCFIHL